MGNAALRAPRDEPAAKRWSKSAEAAGEGELAKAAGALEPPWPGEKKAAERAVVTVKVVMTRKEAERLAARLREQRARGRKARMAELKNELRAGAGGRGDGAAAAVARPGPRGRDEWAQSLAPIQER
uniref:Uncharacterized protein n=1 Tax=Oryza punctata TaxID=4537 RepID=A0A0E0JMH3_ORYPU